MSKLGKAQTIYGSNDVWPSVIHYTTTRIFAGKPFPPGTGTFDITPEIMEAARARRLQSVVACRRDTLDR